MAISACFAGTPIGVAIIGGAVVGWGVRMVTDSAYDLIRKKGNNKNDEISKQVLDFFTIKGNYFLFSSTYLFCRAKMVSEGS